MSRLKACLLSCIVFFVMTLLFTSPTYAHVVSKPGAECHALLVHVYKNKPTTTICLLTEVQYQVYVHSASSAINPYIKSGGCSNGSALWLYLHANSTGPCIGFIGNGTVYLTNYVIPSTGGISWNDHVSSFFSGCSKGIFAEDNNIPLDLALGYAAYFNPFVGSNFPYSDGSGTVANYSLTGILLDSNCGA
jgi:hypothetical protein